MDYYRSTATKNLMRAVAGEPDGIPIIDEYTDPDILFPKGVGRGHDPSQYVPDMMAAPLSMKTYSPSELDAIYDEQEAKQNSLEHLYLEAGWVNLDQNGQGFCWDYSVTTAVMVKRMAMHLPHVRLCGHAAASIIKKGRDEGGWAGLAIAFQREFGQAEEGDGPLQWPKHVYGPTANKRFDNPEFKAAMLKYRITDDWYDLGKPAYSQELKDAQKATCLADLSSVPTDRNIWSHSTCDIRRVRIEAGSWGYLTLNSWLNWGRRGLGVMRGNYYKADGAVSVVSSVVA